MLLLWPGLFFWFVQLLAKLPGQLLATAFADYTRLAIVVFIADIKTISIFDYKIGTHSLCSKKKPLTAALVGTPFRANA